METVLITGGTGLIGKALTKYLLNKGYSVTILTREPHSYKDADKLNYAAWNVKAKTIDVKALQNADFIIHLAGAGVVDKKWTNSYKEEIINSRTESSRILIQTLKTVPHKIKAIVSASATGWYGPDKQKDQYFKEDEPASQDFLGQTCLLWEQSITEAELLGIRVCKLRTGIVLTPDGGAMAEFIKPLKGGVASILGTGHQMISWIHILDLCRMYHLGMINNLQGSYNAVSPSPVTNKKLILTIAENIRGKFFIPVYVPSLMLKLMMGERSVEVLKSTTASAEKIKNTGFTFLFPTIEAAITQLTSKNQQDIKS